MNTHRIKAMTLAFSLSVVSLTDMSSANADPLTDVLKVGQAKTQSAQKSQLKIDRLADETRDSLQKYKQLIKLVEDLKVYNKKLELQVKNQNERMVTMEKSISEVTVIQRQITPLILRMIDGLEQFVALDMPFHMQERRSRVDFLRANADRSDLTIAEKFRQVLEAYKIENEYGRKIDTYKDKISINGLDRDVNILRVGRIALMFQTTDTEISGTWDQKSRSWVELGPTEYRNAVMKGIRIAKKQASIDILNLPVAAPEAIR